MTLTDLVNYVEASTKVYRKGEVVKINKGVVTVDAFPSRPDLTKTVDCGFVTVGFTEHAATWSSEQLIDTILSNPDGDVGSLPLSEWEQGPSYIHIGAWIGSQTLAFQLMALGELHGLWKVFTPAALRVPEDSEEYQQMIGAGFVLVMPGAELITKIKLAKKKGK